MLSPSTRLSFTTLLLLFQLGYFLYELHWARSHRKQYSWEWGRFHFVALTIAILGAVIGLTVWSHLEASDKNINLACGVGMNYDAGGRGIRIASWVMIMLTFVLAYCGLFYNGLVLGMAIGFGLNFAQLYFALALLLQSRRSGPYPADIAIGIMILDALNAASTTQLSMKRLLVHPVWTVLTLIGQAVGLMDIGLLLHFLMLGHYEVKSPVFYQCSCIRFFWWAWMDSCCAQAPMEKATLWTYYIFRWMMFAHAACFALRYTLDFRACRKLEPVQKYVVEQGIVPSGLNANFWKEMEIMGQASERPRATPQRRQQQQHINELLDGAGRGTSHERSLSRPVRLADFLRWSQFQYWTNRRSTLTLNFVMNTM